jgi:hypothetical protein
MAAELRAGGRLEVLTDIKGRIGGGKKGVKKTENWQLTKIQGNITNLAMSNFISLFK